MANTKENVMVGNAVLAIREPNDALAAWSTAQRYAGSYSAKLYKSGSGGAGSTHVQLTLTPSTVITLATFEADPTDFGFWYHYSAVTGNFCQLELKFEDPDSDAWLELTVVPHQSTLGTAAWVQYSCAGTDLVGWGGVGELGASFFDWSLAEDIDGIEVAMELNAAITDPGPWQLARVRVELWEAIPERTAYIDSIEIDGTVYTVEPGGTAPGLELSSPYVDLGYTKEGVTVTYNADTPPILVEEETFPIDFALTAETCEVTANLAESSLANLGYAMAGSVVSGNILTLGGGVLKTMNLRLIGTAPGGGGYERIMYIPKASATGSVAKSFRKGEETLIPVTFQAIKTDLPAVFWVDNAA